MKKYLDEDGLLQVVQNIKTKEDEQTEKLKEYTDDSIQSEKQFNEEYFTSGDTRIKSLLMKSGYKDNVLVEDAKYQGGILAVGYDNKVDGYGSVIGGTGNTNTGSRSIVVSKNSTNTGSGSAVFGELNNSNSSYSIIGGQNNDLDQICGYSISGNIVGGFQNHIEGQRNIVSGLYDFCAGNKNIQYGGLGYYIIVNGPDENGYYTIVYKQDQTQSLNNQLSYYSNFPYTAIIEQNSDGTVKYHLVKQYMVDGDILFKFVKYNSNTSTYKEILGDSYDNAQFIIGINQIIDGSHNSVNGSIVHGDSCLVNGHYNFVNGGQDPLVSGWNNICYGHLSIGYGTKSLNEGSVIGRGNIQVRVNNPRIVSGQCLLDIYSGDYYTAYQEIYKNLGNLSTINDIFKYSVICKSNGPILFGTTILGVKEITDTAITCIVSHITQFDPSQNYKVRINGTLVAKGFGLATGYGSTSWGNQSFSGGSYGTAIGANSIAFGYNTISIGKYSQSFGNSTVTQNDNETALGTYNVSTKGETAFSVGNGTSAERHNLLELKNNGDLIINDNNITQNISDLSTSLDSLKNIHGDAWVQIDQTNPSCEVKSQSAPFIKGRRCLVKPTESGVSICYLDENNSNLFHDGKTEAKLDGTMGEFMVDLPEFYYKGVTDGDIYTYNIWQNNVKGAHKSRRVLLGAVEATSVDNVLHSRVTGNQSTGNLTSVVFHQQANALGAGFDIVDYDAHCKVAWMQYAKYGNLNSQAIIGAGDQTYTRIIGTTASLGNNDGADRTNTTIFGLENWWGGKWEYMGGIYEWNNSGKGKIYVFDGFLNSTSINGNPLTMGLVSSASDYRELYYTITANKAGYISKMLLGEYGDLIPIEFNGSSSSLWADYSWVNLESVIAGRSNDRARDRGGATCFSLSDSPSKAEAYIGSRLLYRGNIEVIEDPNQFISL